MNEATIVFLTSGSLQTVTCPGDSQCGLTNLGSGKVCGHCHPIQDDDLEAKDRFNVVIPSKCTQLTCSVKG